MLLPNRVGLLVQGMVRVGLVQKGMEAEGLKSTLSATALERAKSSWRSLCQFQRQTFFFFWPRLTWPRPAPMWVWFPEGPAPRTLFQWGLLRVHGDDDGGGGGRWLVEGSAAAAGISQLPANVAGEQAPPRDQ